MRIGVDVGGTNTDAVLMKGDELLAYTKAPTSNNVSDGIINSVTMLIAKAKVDSSSVKQIMIGTTHFVNSFVERRNLLEPMVLRIGLPAGRGVPPTSGWPDQLCSLIGKHVVQVEGGYQFDGREISPFDELAVRDAARAARAAGIRSVAVSCIFSHVNNAMEVRARDIIREELPNARITLSSEVGRLGMLERENAAIINASLAEIGLHAIESMQSALKALSLEAPLYLSQNDGTLMSAQMAAEFPVLTFASGPTNSMRGAAYLTRQRNAIVADIGGTTTDCGMLTNGFPREATLASDFGGVRTNFRMPDVVSSGLGGGSIVRTVGNDVTVGPDSVGFRLTEQARVFGGDVVTTTDIAVAAGYTDIGDASRVRDLPADLVRKALAEMNRIFSDTIDRVRIDSNEVPLVLVGGGSILIDDAVPGTSESFVPEGASVANAIGASIAQIGGEVDRVFLYEHQGRDAALQEARDEACQRALEAGAVKDSIEVVDILETSLISMAGGAVRVRVRAVGELAPVE